MKHPYTSDRATLLLLSLLKAHGVRRVIASPGTTHMALVASMQGDGWFRLFSAPDERSAAYMACGMAAASGEAVAVACTEATASRNYLPGLTEAYYRKLPVLAITGTHGDARAGHLNAQSIDRGRVPRDAAAESVSVGRVSDGESEWLATVAINRALLALTRRGGGPAHINLMEAATAPFTADALPAARAIRRYDTATELPGLTASSVAVFIGAHRPFTPSETEAVERFCQAHNGAVVADHTSGYRGRYRVGLALLAAQHCQRLMRHPELIVHIGEVSGDVYSTYHLYARETWRVSPDGEPRDLFRNLTAVFEMPEREFFARYGSAEPSATPYHDTLSAAANEVLRAVPELPFSNVWIARQTIAALPPKAVVHAAIFNSLRSWDFFPLPPGVDFSCNVGGFGIDGALSTLLGAALARPGTPHFGIVGDLAFFYDLNALGNRHLPPNVRLLLVNNGCGTEFRNYDHPAAALGPAAAPFIAAEGHYGAGRPGLAKAWAEALGLTYIEAHGKDELLEALRQFADHAAAARPMLLEAFTTPGDESQAISLMRHIVRDDSSPLRRAASRLRQALGV